MSYFRLCCGLVVHQEVEPKYEESNPITVTSIREQLDYFLDKQSFLNITDKRFGYSLPSRVLRASIVASYTLEGIASPWEVLDFRFEVIFKRQSARD